MDAEVGHIAGAPGGTEFVQRLFAEVVATVGAEWRALTDAFKSQVLALLTDGASNLTSSMYRDMKSAHRIEADQIVGDLVRHAAARGVATPLLSTVLVRLKVYEETQRAPTPLPRLLQHAADRGDALGLEAQPVHASCVAGRARP